jgi:hypothetical protein
MIKRSLLFWVLMAFVVALLSVPAIAFLTRRSSRQAGQTMMGSTSMVAPMPPSNMMLEQVDSAPYEYAADVSQNQKMMAERSGAGMMPIAPGEPAPDSFTPATERSIVRTASLGLVVKNVRQTVRDITSLVTSQQGFVTSSSVSDSIPEQDVVVGNMTLRVPNEKLESILESLRGMADRVTADYMSAADKTTQRIDLEARLSNLRATETQLLCIMSRATTVEDTLSVQKELQNVRDTIERLQAQLDYLKGDASMSTITVSLSTKADVGPIVPTSEPTIQEELKATLVETVRLYRQLFLGLVKFLIVLSPVILIVAVVFFWRKASRKK